MLGEPAGTGYVFDDVGGLVLLILGTPTLGLPSLARGEQYTSARGGYTTQTNGFQAAVSGYLFGNGVTVEGATQWDYVNGSSFYLFNAPGQASLEITGAGVSFSVWTAAQHTLTAASVLTGPPQVVQGTYDPAGGLQAIYVDGALVASQALTGAVATVTTGNTQLLTAAASSATVALGQDIAIYDGALPQSRITQHFAAFMQQWVDPGHVFTYPYIGVAQQ
jgi:hypothetical protein